MPTLTTPHRRLLESAVKHARKIATGGACKSLEALAVHEADPYQHMDEAQRRLRRKLRAQAKQLGDGESRAVPGTYEIKHLVEKLAYDQWHRLLFARYLMENELLISPEHGVAVSLDDCEELAQSQGLKDAWAVAARFAAVELPEIFRADDPAGAVELPVEDRKPLIALVIDLPVDVFTASDSLGWCYQFWQSDTKNEVNAAGNKIGADELPSVTQLFTEDYMVDFLLDNTLGAWHAGKRLKIVDCGLQIEDEAVARAAVALPGCEWKYLRLVKGEPPESSEAPSSSTIHDPQSTIGWRPAAGTFPGWPTSASELKCLDPCMGSGHFIVAMFERLVALRMAEENLDEAAAVAAVIRDNLFGLEIDPRCTQIAAFNLALAAWRRVGHCKLPPMNLACSGLAPNATKDDWLQLTALLDGDSPLAGERDLLGPQGQPMLFDARLAVGMSQLYDLFQKAPVLGSLINPRAAQCKPLVDPGEMMLIPDHLLFAPFHELQPLLEKALAQETRNDAAREMAVTARGLAKAAEILAGKFTLVATNVPYLGRGKQDDVLMDYCGRVHPEAKADLSTCFVERCLEFCAKGSSTALVTPQNWLFLGTYKNLRQTLLSATRWEWIARLGPKGFQTPMWDFNIVLFALTAGEPEKEDCYAGIDVGDEDSPAAKAAQLISGALVQVLQKGQLGNPDFRIGFESLEGRTLLRDFANTGTGMQTFDSPRFLATFWEFTDFGKIWVLGQSTVPETCFFGGRETAVRWENGKGHLYQLVQDMAAAGYTSGIWKAGSQFWGNRGVLVSLMGSIPCTVYDGVPFNNNTGAIIPKDSRHLLPIWAYCSSSEFAAEVRKVDQKLNVTNATLVKVPFDLEHWQKVAAEKYPDGLPKPFSSDPTQWLFNGHPAGSDQPLHVAVARLLGYQWPRQTGSSFPDCPALGPDGLEPLADADGIVCLSATKGEAPGAERLRVMLAQALGKLDLPALLASAGPGGKKSGKAETLEDWLRDEFFEQHCALFGHRPFIWHIWDGHKNGFSALVNYHKLTHAKLENLTYAYLGDWIRRQQAAVDAGESGSDARLQAAKLLQTRLKSILEGEPPYDIFVRWKGLASQAIGWHPDLNDGVRMNIRPFLAADIPGGKKGAGLLRVKPNIKWDKDRGKEPQRDKAEFPWFWQGSTLTGDRVNDVHLPLEMKKGATP